MPKKPTVPRAATAYSYIRFSSPEQARGQSVERQTVLRDAWLAKSGAVLDTTLRMTDAGVSAFRGSHLANPDQHALAAFVELVKQGRIERGSYLIVESLDRLSREHIQEALFLFLSLTRAHIRVVQLLPVEQVFDENSDSMPIMMAVMELSRGHSESRMKSERSGAAWAARKKKARDGQVLTKAVPAWIETRDGKMVLIEPAAETVRLVYRLARAGYGVVAITKKLNADGVPTIARAATWSRCYVGTLLRTRSVMGEYQPHTGNGRDRKNRKPEGPPIPGYYPAAVTEADWNAARSALVDRRRVGPGGREAKSPNLFAKILYDARDGNPLNRAQKGAAGIGPVLVNSKAEDGAAGDKRHTFPAEVFEAAVLSKLREVDPREILPADDGPYESVSLAGRLSEIDATLAKVKARIVAGGEDVDPLIDVVRDLTAERKAVDAKLADARRKEASPLANAWGDCRTLLDALANAPDPHDARIRLRSAIRRVVSGI